MPEQSRASFFAPRLLFVVPCYNEAEVVGHTASQLIHKLHHLADNELCSSSCSGILFVDDGSSDGTWDQLVELSIHYPSICAIRLSRNKGHQFALLAGLHASLGRCDVTISVDADMQDDIDACENMLRLYMLGYQIVYGVRNDRASDSLSKRLFANAFYWLMQRLDQDMVLGHADFRLISESVLSELNLYKERVLFLRGIMPKLGYKSASISYARKKRFAGKPKYSFYKSVSLAIDGILSFSSKPLRLITYLGLLMCILSALGISIIVYAYVIGVTVQGWASLMVLSLVLGGAQLLCLGVIGEYISRIHTEVKQRPRYHVQETAGKLLYDSN